MGRRHRSYLPGAVFHLTTRTQGGEPWFTPVLRTRLVDYAASAIRRTDATLLAYAIMPNHLHLVLRQGRQPLDRVMQPLLRRAALVVQRSHGLVGHVFQRRYRDHVCLDPDYARNTIVYTHLNPVRAGLLEDPGAYDWASHRFYLGDATVPEPMASVLAVDDGLRLFAPWDGCTISDLRGAYSRLVGWQLERDRQAATEEPVETARSLPPRPFVLAADTAWSHSFAPLFRDGTPGGTDSPSMYGSAAGDLDRIARHTLAEHAPDLQLDEVRTNSKRPAIVRARRRLIPRLAAAGHSGAAIARFLGVSQQCVSNVLRSENSA